MLCGLAAGDDDLVNGAGGGGLFDVNCITGGALTCSGAFGGGGVASAGGDFHGDCLSLDLLSAGRPSRVPGVLDLPLEDCGCCTHGGARSLGADDALSLLSRSTRIVDLMLRVLKRVNWRSCAN